MATAQRLVRTADGRVVQLAVIWEPADAAALARELAALTGRPVQTLPARLREDHR